MNTHMPAIEADGLTRRYGEATVLDIENLQVGQGEAVALLGPNGAGKTTLVNILSTLIKPTAGTGRVLGHDVVHEADAVRSMIGVTGQFSAVDDLLTGRENLTLMADLHHLPRALGRSRSDELLETFELVEAADRVPATYSGGMRRRLDLAMTLIGRPKVIFLDEPTTGLDPRSRRTVWEIVRGHLRDGVTILLTTQYLHEADELADRVVVLDAGRIVADGTPDALKGQVPGGHVRVTFDSDERLAVAASALGSPADSEHRALNIPIDGSVASLRGALDLLTPHESAVTDITVHRPDLDDVFLALTGHAAAPSTTTTEALT
jgi:ABC-2 type transport system ATP-binding protein